MNVNQAVSLPIGMTVTMKALAKQKRRGLSSLVQEAIENYLQAEGVEIPEEGK